MATLAEIRAQHPEYNDLSDAALADGIHKKFYSDMPRDQFDAKIGLMPAAPDRGAFDAGIRGIANVVPFLDEGVGKLGGALSWLGGGTFAEGENRALANARGMDAAAADYHPLAFYGGQGAATLATLPLAPELAIGKAAKGAGLAAKVIRGAETGGAYSALYGAGAADGGIEGRAAGALGSGVAGAATGGLLPVAAAAAGAVLRPVGEFIRARRNPAETAARIVDKQIAAGGRDVGVVSRRMADAAARGDPLSLADVGGDQVQRLGRTVINLGGPGASALKTKINAEAVGQGARIAAAVDQHLGVPGTTYQEAKHAIMDARSHAATPHYDRFYQTPVPYSRRLEGVLDTPAGRAGLAAARTNSLNRREPWAQWFLNVAPDGTLINARRVPDARALDEVRRAIRAQLEDAMAPPAGQPFARPRDTPRSIAIRSVYDDLTDEMMAAGETRAGARNGPFAAANQAGLDNIQADEAIEFGRDIFKNDPRVIAQRMGQGGPGRHRVFNAGQQELVRVGAADAVRQAVESGNFTANKLYKFFSSPEDMARLRPLFRTPRDFQAFRREMLNEALKRKKLQAMTGNSTTAQQLADIQGTGNLEEMMQTATDLLRGRPWAAAMGWLTRAARRNGILTPQVTDQIQRLISTRDIPRVQAIIRQLDNVQRSRASQAQKLNAGRNLLTKFLAASEGQTLQPSQPPR